jgi:single-stranded DNA-specific DHH superfamily exonuclease
MITSKEITEFRQELQTTKRPLIFFDDDCDGLCSFLLLYNNLKPYAEEIKGIVIKASPVLKHQEYSHRITEWGPDKVFVLDKPMIEQDFIDSTKVPIVWLDHHPLQNNTNIKYFNPLKHKSKKYDPDNRPTTYWAYKITDNKKLLWIAMTGCVADWFIPEFYKTFSKEYPDLLPKNIKIRNPGTLMFDTEIGRLSRIMHFNLKGHNITKSIAAMMRITDPYDILKQRTSEGRFIYKNYEKMEQIYQSIKSQVKVGDEKIVLFQYESNHAFTGELSNELHYRHPDKLIIITRSKNDQMICSLRSEKYDVRSILAKSLEGINGHGGGHMHACGAAISTHDFRRFLENMKENLEN